MALQLVITNAGRAAVIDQANGGFRAVRIASVGVSPTPANATPGVANLGDEVKRIATIAGEATATDVTHLTVTDETNDSYIVRSFALYLSDGTLFALYGQSDPIVQKSTQALLLLSLDIMLSNIPASAITFGNANFTNPAATTERAGVVELATSAETEDLADVRRAVTPSGLAAILGKFAKLAGARFTGLVRMLAGAELNSDANALLTISNPAANYSLGAFAGTDALIVRENQFGAEALRVTRSGMTVPLSATIFSPAANYSIVAQSNANKLQFRDNQFSADCLILDASVAAFSGKVTARLGFYTDDYFYMTTPAAGLVDVGMDRGDVLRFNRTDNQFAFIIGDDPKLTIDPALGARFMTKLSGRLGVFVDDDCYLRIPTAGLADLGFDAGDVLRYNRSSNQYDFLIASSSALTITAGQLTRAGSAVWDAGNDGAGSGLDADLLDGRQASDFIERARGSRQLDYDPNSGELSIRGDAGGWTLGYTFRGADGVALGGFGVAGGGSSLPAYYYVGAGPNATNNLRVHLDRVTYAGNTMWHAGNDGAGSGLDADLLNGQQGSWYADVNARLGFAPLPASSYTAADVLAKMVTVDGAGSGLDADLLDGQQGSWYADVSARLGFAPLPASTYTAADVLAKAVTVDGAGSGLDADMLDGWHRDEVRDWNSLLNKPAAFPVAAHTHGAADIAGAFPGSLSGNGYTVLPNGLILQWVTGAQQGAGSEGTQYVVFPIAFPNACFQVITSTQVANPNTESHATYQLISNSNEGATVMRQLVSSAGADREPSWPRLFAIGR